MVWKAPILCRSVGRSKKGNRKSQIFSSSRRRFLQCRIAIDFGKMSSFPPWDSRQTSSSTHRCGDWSLWSNLTGRCECIPFLGPPPCNKKVSQPVLIHFSLSPRLLRAILVFPGRRVRQRRNRRTAGPTKIYAERETRPG